MHEKGAREWQRRPDDVVDLYYRINILRLELPPLRERPEDLPLVLLHPKGHFQPHPYREALERFRREYAAQILACAGGNMRKAAKLAGVDLSTLYRLGARSEEE